MCAGSWGLAMNRQKDRLPARKGNDPGAEEFLENIRAKESRKQRARRQGSGGVWFGLGNFGVVGMSVAIPTVLGVFLGLWIDGRWPSRTSWTLTLLFVGLVLGLVNAWIWVDRERGRIEKEREE